LLYPSQSQKNGPGKLTTKEGIVYEGTWVNDELDGKGTMAVTDSNVIDVFWRESFMERPGFDIVPPMIPAIKVLRL
jgi:hypothetical protein